MGQILNSKSILIFDHIPQDETEGVSFHHPVESTLVNVRQVRRKEESICWILSEDLYPSHPEHPFNRERVT